MTAGFFTIGHSNRDIEEFTAMLRAARIDLLADVRSFPRSRSNPVFNIDTLPPVLAGFQIGYDHFPGLGGRRAKQLSVDPQTNALWRVSSFHNYADYALGAEFTAAFGALMRAGDGKRVAIMCAEAVWWRCHRRIITDYLLCGGHSVEHLMAPGRSEAAKATPGAVCQADGRVFYPAAIAPGQGAWPSGCKPE